MVNSIKKGKRGEREVAKLFSEWWGGEFSRTPDSGAFMTTHTKAVIESGNDLSGDLITPADFPFNVEVKLRKEIDLWEIVRTPTLNKDEALLKDNLITWWYQSEYDASYSKKIPMVIMKENRKQWYFALPLKFYFIHNKYYLIKTGTIIYKNMFYVCSFKNVLDVLTKEQILHLCSKYKEAIDE